MSDWKGISLNDELILLVHSYGEGSIADRALDRIEQLEAVIQSSIEANEAMEFSLSAELLRNTQTEDKS